MHLSYCIEIYILRTAVMRSAQASSAPSPVEKATYAFNNLRTILQRLKNNEARPKFTGSFFKKAFSTPTN